MKYTDDELIQLVSLNPGFGLDRMIKQILPDSDADKRRDIRYDIIQLLAEYKKNLEMIFTLKFKIQIIQLL